MLWTHLPSHISVHFCVCVNTCAHILGSGVPKTILRFNVLPEGLKELIKAVMLTVTIYYREKTLKSAKVKRTQVKIQESLEVSFQFSSPKVPCRQCSVLPAVMCDIGTKILSREAHLSLGIWQFGRVVRIVLKDVWG